VSFLAKVFELLVERGVASLRFAVAPFVRGVRGVSSGKRFTMRSVRSVRGVSLVIAAGAVGYAAGNALGQTKVGGITIHRRLGNSLYSLCPSCWNW
jgi:hypothetical protein